MAVAFFLLVFFPETLATSISKEIALFYEFFKPESYVVTSRIEA